MNKNILPIFLLLVDIEKGRVPRDVLLTKSVLK